MSTFCDHLYDEVEDIWQAQLEHPFVRGIGRGDLDVEVFKNWVRQDYLYLKEFSRVFAWGAAKANQLEEMQFFAGALDLTLNTEMDLHRSYAERFGIEADELEQTEMWPTTRAYTDFLVRVAADGDFAELLAALLPCAWGYAWLGRRLEETVDEPDDERYADWIATYTDEDFQGAADHLRQLMNQHGGQLPAGKQQDLVDLFVLSSQYELEFWQMCWEAESFTDTG
jgi:thiaminase/transcriptional activator TenA